MSPPVPPTLAPIHSRLLAGTPTTPRVVDLDTLPIIAWCAGSEGALSYLNGAWATYTGLAVETSVADGGLDAVHPDDREALVAMWAARQEAPPEDEAPVQVEYRLRRHDGQYRWHMGVITPMLDGSGQRTGWLGTAVDIDEAYRARADRADAANQLALVLRHVDDQVALVEQDGTYAAVSDAYARAFGAPPGAIVGQRFDAVAQPVTVARRLATQLASVLLTGQARTIELDLPLVQRDGRRSRTDVRRTVTPWHDVTGALRGGIVRLSPLGSTTTLLAPIERLLSVLEDRVFVLDRDWRFVAVNPAAAQHLGRTVASLIGESIWTLYPALRGTPFERFFTSAPTTLGPDGVGSTHQLTVHGRRLTVTVQPFDALIAVVWRDDTEAVPSTDESADEAGAVLFEAAPFAVAQLDLDGRFVRVNARMAAINGVPVAAHRGRMIEEVAPGNAAAVRAAVARVVATGATVVDEVTGASADAPDAPRTWRTHWTPLLGADGAVARVLCLAEDITDAVRLRQHADRLAREAEAERDQLRAAFDQSPGFVASVMGTDHRFEYVNARYVVLAGHRPLLGRTVREAFPEIIGQGLLERLDAVCATGEPFVARGMTVVLAHRPGAPPESRRLDFVYQPLFGVAAPGDTRRPVVGILVQGHDVTEAVRANEALARSEHRYRTLFESIDEGYCVIELVRDADGEAIDYRFREVNPAFARHTGLVDAVGHTISALVTGGEPGWVARYAALLRDGRPLRVRDEAPNLKRWFDVFAFPLPDDGPDCIAVLFSDATPQVLAQREREAALAEVVAARARAEAADRAKGQFLATMTHELRTPLAAIIGYVRLLTTGVRGPLTDAQRTDLERIRVNEAHLRHLVDDVLDFAQLESGRLRVGREACDLGRAVQDAAALVLPQAMERGLEFVVEGDAGTHVAAADHGRVRQIVGNLLGNAVKFTPPGGRITARAGADGAETIVDVEDTGIGIPLEKADRIFEPFEQAHPDLPQAHEGVGLGLAISRELARAMGGALTLVASSPAGSTFRLRLPRWGAP
ncbi:MAG: PAS domain-containing protein [Gemmatimonadaceae bacterium]|jgi:PAS domain S-box-containing protein|nr:PAS domain-containing protein [Gemmatimonadaceae bacterium]